MEELSKDMIGALNNKAYVIGGLNIPESVIITWCIMAFLVIVSILFTRNLKIVPSKPQMVVEAIVGFINNFFTELLGERGKKYIPYLGTVLIYLGVANTIGLFGITPPTKDINMTTALALMSAFSSNVFPSSTISSLIPASFMDKSSTSRSAMMSLISRIFPSFPVAKIIFVMF